LPTYRTSALLKGAAAGILFGTAAIFIRLLSSMDSLSIALGRLAIASSALAIMLLIARPRVQANALRGLSRFVVALGILIGMHFLLFVSAVKDTSILNATVLVNTTPVFAMVFSCLILRTRPSTVSILGASMAFTGMLALSFTETSLGLVGNLRGDIEATAAAVLEGLYLNIGKGVRRRVPTIVAMLPIYITAAALVIGATGVSGRSFVVPIESSVLLSLIGLGLLPTALGHTLYFSSLSDLKSFQTATLAMIEPIMANLLGLLVFGEVPGVQFVFGAAMILLGIFMVVSE